MQRAKTKIKNKTETLLAVYSMSPNPSARNASVQHSAAWMSASCCAPCLLPLACYLPYEYRAAADGTLYAITDRTIYRLVDDDAVSKLHCTRLASNSFFKRCLRPPTGAASGEVSLTRITAIGTDVRRFDRVGGAPEPPSTSCASPGEDVGLIRPHARRTPAHRPRLGGVLRGRGRVHRSSDRQAFTNLRPTTAAGATPDTAV